MLKFTAKKVKIKDDQVIIREQTEKDIPYIVEMLKHPEVLKYLPQGEPSIKLEKDIFEYIKSTPLHYLLIAELDGTVIGRLNILGNNWKKRRHIADFDIAVHHKYQNRGVGKALMEEFFSFARKLKFEKIETATHADNKKAIKFYESLGFEKEGVTKKSIKRDNGEYIDYIHMAKWL